MKKINFSKIFHERKLLFFSVAILVVMPMLILWIIPTLKSFFWNFSHQKIGALSLQFQTMIILSIILYPLYSFLLCVTISSFHHLKSQTEGGLLSDTIEAFNVGCIWFIVSCIPFIGILFGIPLTETLTTVNQFLFIGTGTGIIMSLSFLFREFNPKKLPIERIGHYTK
jgi:hypothetical protein